MADETDVIREQMAQTRSSLSDKLERLEQRVFETAENTVGAVEDSAFTLKHCVQDSVQAVSSAVRDSWLAATSALDAHKQVEQYPWSCVAASVGAGFIAGCLVPETHLHTTPEAALRAERMRPGPSDDIAQAERCRSGWLKSAIEPLRPEIHTLKELGVGMILGLVRDFVNEAAPESVRSGLIEVLNDVTRKVGGRPLPSPILTGFGNGASTGHRSAFAQRR
jgi:ElaB/YqjD/DUF883 family membrane-anchored ribosome-binding protein